MIMNGDIDLMINTPFGQETRSDGYHLRTGSGDRIFVMSLLLLERRHLCSAIETIRESERLLLHYKIWSNMSNTYTLN